MARRPIRRGPRIRRPLTLVGGLLFAVLSAAVVAIGFDGVPLPPLPGLSPAPKAAVAPAETEAPVAPDHPTPWPPAVDTVNAPPPGPVAAPAAPTPPAPASAPPAAAGPLRGQRSEPTAPAAPVVKISPPPAARPAPPAQPRAEVPAAAIDAGDGPAIQVGAFASEGLSEAAWSEITRIWPDKTAGKRHATETTERNGRTIYRSRVSGFANRAEAQAFCGALRASGRDCFLK